ncbi:MAG: isoleucine--tRNA ligase [Candidatus Bipolaricaulota bacterium]|nr:MAG: isoleucine--tRNA ligase [Candidatus Bipolaricaulota bacterium]
MNRYEKLTADPLQREAEVLALWREQDTFRASLEATRDGEPYVFYEGPPTANGSPHLGHLMPRVYKDLFPRYQTMRGRYVLRRGGWDTHGLPVELEVEKELGINSKPEIEALGVESFVERCKESVWRYKEEWERMIERMGFWIDLENAYVTYTDPYIETVWWELKTMFDRGLLYQGHKTLPYCPRCGTGLSSHEVAQGYQTVKDPSVTVRLPVTSDDESEYRREGEDPTSLLTWTTTPWTLPANVAVAVAPEAEYVEVEVDGERLILARALLASAVGKDARILRTFAGKALIGVRYRPPYVLTEDAAAHRVVPADFVNLEDGTGLVHIASAFGEDDYRLGQEMGLPFVQPVDLEGAFTTAFPLGAGRFVKDVDPEIVSDLGDRGLLFRITEYEHDYPFCWRCDTPLLYYAADSWYVRTTAVRDEMIDGNRRIHWYPAHVGEGRLADFLANLKDWALSRDRYWGTPLNLWVCDHCDRVTAIGSRAELVAQAIDPDAAADVEFHRPYIDRVRLRCEACAGEMTRVPYVIDTWFDSGSMHAAQWHYPFENEEAFSRNFPADFICEAAEQTRGWFYTLLATSTIIHGDIPYRNCIGTGLGLDESGAKMSKSRGNVIDPWDLLDELGADCIRWFLLASSAPWTSKRLGEANVKEPLYKFLDTLRNSYDFFALYASIDGYEPDGGPTREADRTALDRWLLSRVASTTRAVRETLDAYDVLGATGAIEALVDELSNWYVRASRRRFWRGGMSAEKGAAYDTLYSALVEIAKMTAPFIPFLAEAIYQCLRRAADPPSVHLCRFPEPAEEHIDEDLERRMALARRIAALGRQARSQAEIRVRQPLQRLVVDGSQPGAASLGELATLVAAELNVEAVDVVEKMDGFLDERATPEFASLGPRLGPAGPAAAEWIRGQDTGRLREALAAGPVTASIDGGEVQILASDVRFETEWAEGWSPAAEGSLRVLLDTTLTEELRRAGLLRELVHRIQMVRKEAGLAVTDRVELRVQGDPELESVLMDHRDHAGAELLAVSIERGEPEALDAHRVLEIDDKHLTIGLSRAAEKNS